MRQNLIRLSAGLLFAFGLSLDASRVIAHSATAIGDLQATVHLEPNDSPYAGMPSPTWFHLIRPDGQSVSLADCDCSLVVYDSQNQPLMRPELSEASVEGHGKSLTTNITFPNSGSYQLMLTGRSRTNAFEPFELSVPVTVRPAQTGSY